MDTTWLQTLCDAIRDHECVVLSGGPATGKTTILTLIHERLGEDGPAYTAEVSHPGTKHRTKGSTPKGYVFKCKRLVGGNSSTDTDELRRVLGVNDVKCVAITERLPLTFASLGKVDDATRRAIYDVMDRTFRA